MYTTEVEGISRTVSVLGKGFLIRDSSGCQTEYGTTDDSRVMIEGAQNIREWRLTKRTDYHGNSVTYSYVKSPLSSSSTADVNTCYISSIRYGSNEKTGLLGSRIVRFEYAARPDMVVQTTQGTKSTWASILKAIHLGVAARTEGDIHINRSYELSYTVSPHTGDSHLSSVIETSISHGSKLSLLPSTFGYTSPGVEARQMFEEASPRVINLGSTTDNVALLTANISGRCLADIACVRYNRSTQQLTLKTYLANTTSDGKVTWRPSDGPGAEANLPLIERKTGFPTIMCPDMNNDGRADIVIPYPDRDNRICFSISQCVGTGYQSARVKTTNNKWTDGSKFMAVDNPGRGTVDIVQMFAMGQKLALRNYSAINQNGSVSIDDPTTTQTAYDFEGTLDWFQLALPGTGGKCLTRIWAQDIGRGLAQLKATTFTLDGGENSPRAFRELKLSVLGEPVRTTRPKASVLPCDINADSTQDIVLASTEYSNNQMIFTLTTYLGDGMGGFVKHGETTKTTPAPAPLNSQDYGQFHITNLNGSNYPSLSFVYQERATKAYVCVSIDGRSDGMFGEPALYPLAGNMPSDKMQLIPTDINGNGMGDWLFYTLEGDTPRILPVYNKANVTGFLAWAKDSMGLQTSLSYGPLTDTTVYTSAVDWKNYSNSEAGSYPVIAAPNYVVTKLMHQNEDSINSLKYQVSLRKSYAKARVNTIGRGWQCFEEISTLNLNDGVLTSERYLQTWPFTGVKCQIDVKKADGGVLLKSTKTFWENRTRARGPWKIYRLAKMLETTDMVEGGAVVRSNGIRYQYDVHGNMTLRSCYEQQRGETMFQTYKRCQYTTIDGVTCVLTAEKLSSKESNQNMAAFEPGDCSYTVYENESARAVLKGTAEWSTDVGAFIRRSFRFNEYGKEIETVDAVGLKRTTTYDSVFKSFPVRVVEEGVDVTSTELTAYDEASGLEVAQCERNGALTCFRLDTFGRTCETRTGAALPSKATVLASEFFGTRRFVADPILLATLSATSLNPQRDISFVRQKSPSGSAYLGVKIRTYAREGVNGTHESHDYIDCIKQVRKRCAWDADDQQRIWQSWEYNSLGNQIFESFPASAPDSLGIDWTPATTQGISTSFDILGRPITSVRNAHADQSQYVHSVTSYIDGGARIRESTFSTKDPKPPLPGTPGLTTIKRRFIHFEQKDLIIENTDENGLLTKFQYDSRGFPVSCTDPSGQMEQRVYNSLGDLVSLNNVYQNTAQAPNTYAAVFVYDKAGQFIGQNNAKNEFITFKRDTRGRLVEKSGADGRVIKFIYDKGGVENISSVSVYPHGLDRPRESSVEFTYDHQGRLAQRQLTLENGETFNISMSYDWQDRVVQKTLPDFSVINYEYRGSQLITSSMSDGATSTWALKAETLKSSPYGRPEQMTLRGSGMSNLITHNWRFDNQGFPTSHSLFSEQKLLVQEDYFYNDLGQIARKHELVSAMTTDYTYTGKRLTSSNVSGRSPTLYNYDAAGNLTKHGSMSINCTSSRAIATQAEKTVYEVSYDAAGRMTHRATPDSAAVFTYDAFGSLQKIEDSRKGSSIQFTADFEGETLRRIHSDGSADIFVCKEFSIHTHSDGLRTARHRLFAADEADGSAHLLGTISTTFESAASKRPLNGSRAMDVHFADTKGNITHTFSGGDAKLKEKLDYDDFGLPTSPATDTSDDWGDSTFEAKYFDYTTGLLNFGGRWYDPLVGRFTTPDSILDIGSLVRTDGLNRYAFENNDPINNIDPSGHWSWSSILGLVIGVVLVVAAIVTTVLTAGAAAPGWAALAGALACGGVAGITYSVEHRDEPDAGKFWAGYATNVAIQAAIGAVAGVLGAFAGPARIASAMGRIAIKAAIGGVASVLSKAAERGFENVYYKKGLDPLEGAAKTFAMGAIVSGFAGAFSGRSAVSASRLSSTSTGAKAILEPKSSNHWANVAKHAYKNAGKGALKPGGKLATWGWKELNPPAVAANWAMNDPSQFSLIGQMASHIAPHLA